MKLSGLEKYFKTNEDGEIIDFKQVDCYNCSPLLLALENLNLPKEQWKYLIENSDLYLIKNEKHLLKLKKIQSELLNDEILSKIEIKEEVNKKVKI